ncbi:MAG: anthranilate 1,2-dioxygenase [Alphaproteobacteria bacterium]|nr:anthranilate 1,2-dioxygenase [Alphaproteobacteria bacterium]
MSAELSAVVERDEAVLRILIEDMFSDYVHSIDDDRVEAWPEYFIDNGFYQVISQEGYEAGHAIGVMHCDGKGMMQDRVKAMRQANIFEPHRYTHVIERPRLHRTSSDTFSARTNFIVTRTMQNGDMETFASGKYLDSLDVSGKTPKFRRRIVVLDSRRIDILLVFPL